MEIRGCSSVGRASALQAEGHGFKSLHLHWKMKFKIFKKGPCVRRENLDHSPSLTETNATQSESDASVEWKSGWFGKLRVAETRQPAVSGGEEATGSDLNDEKSKAKNCD